LGEEVYVFAGDVGVNGQTMFHSKFKNINFISSGFGSFGARNNVVIVNVGVNISFKVEDGVALSFKAADEVLKLRKELANMKNSHSWENTQFLRDFKNRLWLIVHYLREKYIWAINYSF
jgi:hypothetical protein